MLAQVVSRSVIGRAYLRHPSSLPNGTLNRPHRRERSRAAPKTGIFSHLRADL